MLPGLLLQVFLLVLYDCIQFFWQLFIICFVNVDNQNLGYPENDVAGTTTGFWLINFTSFGSLVCDEVYQIS